MKTHLALSLLLIALCLPSCTSFDVSQRQAATRLEAVPVREAEVTLYTLDPNARHLFKNNSEVFHGFEILGKAAIESDEEKHALLQSLAKGVNDSPRVGLVCFNPRHGLRVTNKTSSTDYVICFQCYSVKTYNPNGRFLIGQSPRDAYNAIANKHRLKIDGQ